MDEDRNIWVGANVVEAVISISFIRVNVGYISRNRTFSNYYIEIFP